MVGKRTYRIARAIAAIVLVTCLVGLGAIGYTYWSQAHYYKAISKIADVDLSEGDLATMTVDWDALRAENPDVIGWVIIPDTRIDYPVVQARDNESYLQRSFSGEERWNTGGGCIFADSACSPSLDDECAVLYGHHMRDGSMFACLADYSDQDFFEDHRNAYVLTPAANYRLEVFSCVLTTGDDEIVQTSFASGEAREAYFADKLARNVIDPGTGAPAASAIKHAFMLVTCEYSQSDGRACVFANVAETAAL